jgi:hypothetical protein
MAAAGLPAHMPYNVVFMIEIAFLVLAVFVALTLGTRAENDRRRAGGPRPAMDTQNSSVEVP